jgi:hypothetical protein
MFGLLYDPEDVGDMFLRNIGHELYYMMLRPAPHNHRCENAKPHEYTLWSKQVPA